MSKFDLKGIAQKAQTSSFNKWLLNQGLNRMIPFNYPHQLKVMEIGPNHLKVKLPYKKRNLNHLKGLHACALATLAEVSSGLLLISSLDPKDYRIILKKLEMDYQYQGKTEAYSSFGLSDNDWSKKIMEPLTISDSIVVDCPVEIKDAHGNLVAIGTGIWQIKKWGSVRTKV